MGIARGKRRELGAERGDWFMDFSRVWKEKRIDALAPTLLNGGIVEIKIPQVPLSF